MIELDGVEYTVDDTSTIAYNLLAYINTYMTNNSVTDSKGNIVQFKINIASPVWLIIFGVSYMIHVVQKIMYACGQSFSISSCADQQVLNLAQIARVQRKQGTYTTINARVTATSAGVCNILTTLEATATYSGTSYTFSPVYPVSIPAGGTETVVLACTVIGPVYIDANAITSFTTTVDNFFSMTTNASVAGSDIETVNSLRTRLNKNESVIPINGCIDALNALTGITKANVYFNSSFTDNITIENITVPPKCAVMYIQGYSTDIAYTYLKYMSAETVSTTSSHSQTYTLTNGQVFTVNYFAPTLVNIYIKVFLSNSIDIEQQLELTSSLMAQSDSLPMGTNYTQSYLLDQMVDTSVYSSIAGLSVSTDGVTYSASTSLTPAETGLINSANISYEVLN